jgi:hypothetical protein
MSSDKIKENLKNLMDLNDDAYPPANSEIGIVYGYLNGNDNTDNGPSLFSNLLFSAVGLIGNIEGIPAAPAIAWFLSAIVNTFNEKSNPELYNPFPQIAARYVVTYMDIDTTITTIMNDLENHLDDVYTIPDFLKSDKKTITVRELGDYDIPPRYSDNFNICKDKFVIGFRNEMVKQQLPKFNSYGIGCIHIKKMHAYWVYVMTVPGSNVDNIYEWSNDNLEIDNNEIQIQAHSVRVNGDTFQDFDKIAGIFCEKVGGALIVPISKTDSKIEYHKYYLFTGYSEGEHSGWNLSSNDFYEWLFQDDGFGNITRPDAVGMRDDIFRNWGIINGTSIPSST